MSDDPGPTSPNQSICDGDAWLWCLFGVVFFCGVIVFIFTNWITLVLSFLIGLCLYFINKHKPLKNMLWWVVGVLTIIVIIIRFVLFYATEDDYGHIIRMKPSDIPILRKY